MNKLSFNGRTEAWHVNEVVCTIREGRWRRKSYAEAAGQ